MSTSAFAAGCQGPFQGATWQGRQYWLLLGDFEPLCPAWGSRREAGPDRKWGVLCLSESRVPACWWASEGPGKGFSLQRDKGPPRQDFGEDQMAVVRCPNCPVRWVPVERGKDPDRACWKLPAAELEDSLELPHSLQVPFTTTGLAGPGCLCPKFSLNRYWVDGYVCVSLLKDRQDWDGKSQCSNHAVQAKFRV